MSRLSEIENEIDRLLAAQSDWTPLVRKLAAEVDELRGKLDDVRFGIGCARGQRTTQFCAEAARRDAVIDELLAMLEDSADSECYCEDDDFYPIEVCERHTLYRRAVAIAEGRDNG